MIIAMLKTDNLQKKINALTALDYLVAEIIQRNKDKPQ